MSKVAVGGCDGLRGKELGSCQWAASKVAAIYPPSSPTVQQTQTKTQRVLIWHGERPYDGHLSFMYWPVISTLLAGFTKARGVQTIVGVGSSRSLARQINALTRGDFFLWMGPRHRRMSVCALS